MNHGKARNKMSINSLSTHYFSIIIALASIQPMNIAASIRVSRAIARPKPKNEFFQIKPKIPNAIPNKRREVSIPDVQIMIMSGLVQNSKAKNIAMLLVEIFMSVKYRIAIVLQSNTMPSTLLEAIMSKLVTDFNAAKMIVHSGVVEPRTCSPRL